MITSGSACGACGCRGSCRDRTLEVGGNSQTCWHVALRQRCPGKHFCELKLQNCAILASMGETFEKHTSAISKSLCEAGKLPRQARSFPELRHPFFHFRPPDCLHVQLIWCPCGFIFCILLALSALPLHLHLSACGACKLNDAGPSGSHQMTERDSHALKAWGDLAGRFTVLLMQISTGSCTMKPS